LKVGITLLATTVTRYIAAQAAIDGLAILTRDPNRYRTYFPTVRLIGPE